MRSKLGDAHMFGRGGTLGLQFNARHHELHSILTAAASESMEQIHDRQPVILDQSAQRLA
jgi:putative SOS response-associated peptidase YedK